MEYIGIVFGIFGLLAYIELFSLKKRVVALEEELAGIAGTASYEERRSLLDAVSGDIGKQVNLELKEDCEDVDIMMYGNTKHGSNTILDVDQDWMLVRVEGPKWTKEKLIRLESVERITLVKES